MKSKIFIIFIILTFLIVGTNSIVYAVPPSQGQLTDGGSGSSEGVFDPDEDVWKPDSTTEAQGASRLEKIGNTIIGILRTVGSIVSVIVLAVLGIKYMMGSVEEKAEYKSTMMPYLIGAILVFGITNILGIIVDVATSLIN